MSSYCLWSSRTNTRTATFFAALGGQISDASWRRFVLYRLFWNQILTCVSVSFRALASSALSGPDKYFWWLKRLSNSKTWAWEKAALDRFFRGLACCCGLEVEVWLTSLSGWFSVLEKQKPQIRSGILWFKLASLTQITLVCKKPTTFYLIRLRATWVTHCELLLFPLLVVYFPLHFFLRIVREVLRESARRCRFCSN